MLANLANIFKLKIFLCFKVGIGVGEGTGAETVKNGRLSNPVLNYTTYGAYNLSNINLRNREH